MGAIIAAVLIAAHVFGIKTPLGVYQPGKGLGEFVGLFLVSWFFAGMSVGVIGA